ncbi:MAG: hypothetical protein ACYCW6_04285 [Candidatus Xenobia bacterium]
MDELSPEVFEPFEKFIEIEFVQTGGIDNSPVRPIGEKAMVPEKNLLLRCFQYLDVQTITYGSFCWNDECGNCEVRYIMQPGDEPKTVRSCQTTVIEGMKIVASTRHVRRLKVPPASAG